MDNDRDMRVSIEELKAVLSISSQGRTKMNSTLFRNLVEKSEKVKFEGMNSNFKFDPTLRVIPSRTFLTNFRWLIARALLKKIHHIFKGDRRLCPVWLGADRCVRECWQHPRIHAGWEKKAFMQVSLNLKWTLEKHPGTLFCSNKPENYRQGPLRERFNKLKCIRRLINVFRDIWPCQRHWINVRDIG